VRTPASSPAADAVVALDGDRPRRVRAAVALAARGAAPVLVVVRGDAVVPELLAAAQLPFDVLSFVPIPSTTRGEARGVAALARAHGWRHVVVVTSTYHVPRARLIFRRLEAPTSSFAAAGLAVRDVRHLLLEPAKALLALTLRRTP